MRKSCYSTLSVAVCLVMIGPHIAATEAQQTGAIPARNAADRTMSQDEKCEKVNIPLMYGLRSFTQMTGSSYTGF